MALRRLRTLMQSLYPTLSRRQTKKGAPTSCGSRWGPGKSAGSLRAGEAPGGTRARPMVETPPFRRTFAAGRAFTFALLFGVALSGLERRVDRLVQRRHEVWSVGLVGLDGLLLLHRFHGLGGMLGLGRV